MALTVIWAFFALDVAEKVVACELCGYDFFILNSLRQSAVTFSILPSVIHALFNRRRVFWLWSETFDYIGNAINATLGALISRPQAAMNERFQLDYTSFAVTVTSLDIGGNFSHRFCYGLQRGSVWIRSRSRWKTVKLLRKIYSRQQRCWRIGCGGRAHRLLLA